MRSLVSMVTFTSQFAFCGMAVIQLGASKMRTGTLVAAAMEGDCSLLGGVVLLKKKGASRSTVVSGFSFAPRYDLE